MDDIYEGYLIPARSIVFSRSDRSSFEIYSDRDTANRQHRVWDFLIKRCLSADILLKIHIQ